MKKKQHKLIQAKKVDIFHSLSSLRSNESLCDLRFICKGNVQITAHTELIRQASPFLAKIFDIANEKQPHETVCLSLPETNYKIITKLVEIMYLGETTVTKNEQFELNIVTSFLGLLMPLNSKVMPK